MARCIELGSQLFINRTDTPADICRQVQAFANSGLKIMRLFLFWDYVERFENVWDFSQFDACFAQAERCGIAVVPTLMPVSPPGYLRMSAGPQDVGDLNDPAFWRKAMTYVGHTVQRYRHSPALHSWILWNEPSRRMPKTPHNLRALQAFLRDYYQDDIAQVNKLYYNRFTSFTQIEQEPAPQTEHLPFRGYAESADWIRFGIYDLCEKLADIAREVHRWDDHPVHINPHDVGRNMIADGQSVWQEAKAVDFIGCSCHPAWHSTRFDRARLHQSVSQFADLMRSATRHPEQLFWVTELQGGNNIFSGARAMSPDAETISRWIWIGLGCGAEKIIFWCFNTRNEGFEGAEWGLTGLDGAPSPRLQAVSEICAVLKREQAMFCHVRPAQSQVYILHAETNWILSEIEGESSDGDSPRSRMLASDAVSGAYAMCQDLGLDCGFVNEEMVLREQLPDGAVLLAPSVFACCDGLCQALQTFVAKGGTLIADHMFALKDGYGRVRSDRFGLLEELFGVHEHDVGVVNENLSWQWDDLICQSCFIKLDGCASTSNMLGYFSDQTPALFSNTYGKGRAIRIQTVFFQPYLRFAEGASKTCLQRLLPKQIWDRDFRLENPSASLSMKRLSNGTDHVLLFFNASGGVQQARVRLPERSTVRWAVAPADALRRGQTMCVSLAAGQTAVAFVQMNRRLSNG